MTRYEAIAVGGGDTDTPLNFRKRLNLITRYAQVEERRVLDCGCGAGEYVLALNTLGADAWGVEFDAVKVCQFKRSHPESDRVQVGDLERIAFADNSFDVALLNEVLEHVPDDRQALREVNRVLRPRGTLIVFSPNRFYPFESHGVGLKGGGKLPPATPFVPYLPVRFGRKYLNYWARNYWPHQLKAMVREAGFRISATGTVWQTFENISGRQPGVFGRIKPILRTISTQCERTPIIRAFGVSQLIIARKTSTQIVDYI